MNLHVGVIGTGIMGTDHARLLARSVAGAELVRISDAVPGRAETLAAELPGTGVSRDAAELIADPEVAAVVIASDDATHAQLVLAATAAGKPVLCEKPLAPTLAEARRVVEELASTGRTGLVSLGFMRRFDPAYVDLASALRSGAVGSPLVVHNVSRGVSAGPGATSASSVTGSAVHEVDTIPWLLGSPVVEVSWQAPRRTSGIDADLQDPQLILLRTADGTLSTVEVFLNARYGYDIRCEVVGETGTLALAEPSGTVRTTSLTRSSSYAADWRPRFADAYRRELQAWVDSIRTGEPTPLATVDDGLTAATVCEAIITSMTTGGAWTEVPR